MSQPSSLVPTLVDLNRPAFAEGVTRSMGGASGKRGAVPYFLRLGTLKSGEWRGLSPRLDRPSGKFSAFFAPNIGSSQFACPTDLGEGDNLSGVTA